MSGGILNMRCHCRNCLAVLTLEEMHYFDQGNGSATCEKCEREWMEGNVEWLAGHRDMQPERP